ncbi:uncharacterized protein [Nicotiana tomentosiformis]|uniref:uncharacterized protein n=1 Tax=Nicotiana tomentosiformis TaxID=4098 RepID=UPI00388C6772
MEFDEAPSRTDGKLEKDSGKVPESLEIEDASHRSQQTVALALHQEEFSKSRTELSRREADFRWLSKERNALKLLNGQKEEEIKDLRVNLAKAYQDQTDLTEQEVDTIRAETLGWKKGMDRLAAEKETARAQLSSPEHQLQGMKENILVQARKIEELKARRSSTSKTGSRDAQTRAYWVAELAKCQSRRETLEEIHARGFDLTKEIKKAKELEADAGALASGDDDDDGRKNGSENGEDPDGEETAPGDNQET